MLRDNVRVVKHPEKTRESITCHVLQNYGIPLRGSRWILDRNRGGFEQSSEKSGFPGEEEPMYSEYVVLNLDKLVNYANGGLL